MLGKEIVFLRRTRKRKAAANPARPCSVLFHNIAGDVIHTILHHALSILQGIHGPYIDLNPCVMQRLHPLSGERLIIDVQIQGVLFQGILQPIRIGGNQELRLLLGNRSRMQIMFIRSKEMKMVRSSQPSWRMMSMMASMSAGWK